MPPPTMATASLPTMASILSLIEECSAALESAATTGARAVQVGALTTASLRAEQILEALVERAALAPEHFSPALVSARALWAYLEHFLAQPCSPGRAGELLDTLEPLARAALETDEQEESAVVVPWGGGVEIAARVYWMASGPSVEIEGGSDSSGQLGVEVAEAMVGRSRARFDRQAVACAWFPVGM